MTAIATAKDDRAPGIEARGLAKTFATPAGPVTAVEHVDLRIAPGEIVALLGPNGAGKSTTIDMLLGLTRPDRGEIRVFGRSPGAAVATGEVAAMLQTGGLVRGLRVRELVAMMAAVYPAPLPVDEALGQAGLHDIAEHRTEQLSGGEAQRVRLALALVADARLVVLDEPTVGMDVEARRALWTTVRGAVARGKAVLFATHYLEEADRHADRVTVSALASAGSWALSITMCGFLALLMRRRGVLIEELRAAQGEIARLAAADAVIEERLRFARDLHDLLGHTLSVIALKAELARRLLDDGSGRARAQAEVGDLEQIARRALDEVREAVSGYRARSLDRELEHAGAALEAAGVAVTTRNARPALPRDVDDLLAWVVREATTNILRHSQARRAEIALSAADGVARLEMCNDGVVSGAGGSASSGDATGGGSGLIGLRERVAAAGGQLTATPDAGREFRIIAVVPLGEAPAALSEAAR